MKDYIQVAGVIDQAEADMLMACGVNYLGFPLRLPIHTEDLTEPAAAAMIRNLRPPCHGVLITYQTDADEIVQFCEAMGASIIQLHADVDITELRRLKLLNPALYVIKSLVVGLHSQRRLLAILDQSQPFVDAYITDTFDPDTGASGATGRTHDWRFSRELVQASARPVILAGGLTPQNVRQAVLAVRPAGVDAHTGLEDSTGRKSRDKVHCFVTEALAAFQSL